MRLRGGVWTPGRRSGSNGHFAHATRNGAGLSYQEREVLLAGALNVAGLPTLQMNLPTRTCLIKFHKDKNRLMLERFTLREAHA